MFDSPVFWIFLIWWLLSAFAGNKKRKAKLQATMADEIVDEQDYAVDDDAEIPVEEPSAAAQFFDDLRSQKQPSLPEAPPALTDIMRGLGLVPEQPLEPVFVPEVEELEPEPQPDPGHGRYWRHYDSLPRVCRTSF